MSKVLGSIPRAVEEEEPLLQSGHSSSGIPEGCYLWVIVHLCGFYSANVFEVSLDAEEAALLYQGSLD